MFADVEETGSVTITLKNEVTINGNGHTYTLSVDDATNAFTVPNSTRCKVKNLNVLRTGRAIGETGYCFYSNFDISVVEFSSVYCDNDYGTGVVVRCTIKGLNVRAYGNALTGTVSSTMYNCFAESYGTGSGITNPTGNCYDCTGISISVTAITCNGVVSNCIGRSTSGSGIVSNFGYNSVGISTSGAGLGGGAFKNSIGISTSNYGASSSQLDNCHVKSSSGVGYYTFFAGSCILRNSVIESTSNVALTGRLGTIQNCTIKSGWANAGGHAIGGTVGATFCYIQNNVLQVSDASAYCLTASGGTTSAIANNTFIGSTTPVNTANVTQTITNTSDSQGNILI